MNLWSNRKILQKTGNIIIYVGGVANVNFDCALANVSITCSLATLPVDFGTMVDIKYTKDTLIVTLY